jgi:hypothetical protein
VNFEAASSELRNAVSGSPASTGKPARMGLEEFVKKYGPAGSAERESALLECGRVLGFAMMLSGLKEKG